MNWVEWGLIAVLAIVLAIQRFTWNRWQQALREQDRFEAATATQEKIAATARAGWAATTAQWSVAENKLAGAMAERDDLQKRLDAAHTSPPDPLLPDFTSIKCPGCSKAGHFLIAAALFDVPTDPRHEPKPSGFGVSCMLCQTEFCTTAEGEIYRKREKPEPTPERKPGTGNATVGALNGMRAPRGRNG